MTRGSRLSLVVSGGATFALLCAGTSWAMGECSIRSDKMIYSEGQSKISQIKAPDINPDCSKVNCGVILLNFDKKGKSISVSFGERVFYAHLRDNLRMIKSQTGQILVTALSDDSDLSAIVGADGTMSVFDNINGRLLHTIILNKNDREQLGDLCAMSFGADGKSISIIGAAGMKVFSLQDNRAVQHEPAVNCPAESSANSTYIASANNFSSKSDAIFLQKNDAGKITTEAMKELDSEKGPVASVAISNNGQLVALSQAGYDITIFRNYASWIPESIRFSIKSLNYSGKLVGHKGAITSLTVSPDGKEIGSASLDQTARIWNAMDGALIRVFTDDAAPVRVVKFSPNGQCIVTGNDHGILRFWDAKNGTQLKSIELSCLKDIPKEDTFIDKSLDVCFN